VWCIDITFHSLYWNCVYDRYD